MKSIFTKKMIFVFLNLVFVAGLSFAANAATIIFNDFSDVSSLQLNGDAGVVNNVLRVTPAHQRKAGSAFYKVPISVGSFSTKFTFYLHDRSCYWGGCYAADGFTFVLQSSDAGNKAIGMGGGTLGYGGINKSIAVEFDTYQDPTNTKQHIGIDTNGSLNSLKTINKGFYGQKTNVWIDYNIEGDGMLYVYISNSDVKPEIQTLSYELGDLNTYLDPTNVYVGFTAATGYYFEAHDILSWEFDYEPLASVPLPGAIYLLGSSLLGLMVLRRK